MEIIQDSPQNAKEAGKNEIREISRADFPALLKEINDPPSRLFVRGNLGLLEQHVATNITNKFLCVVGSRNASQYGVDVCRRLIAGLRGSNVVIVSGLARGIDAIAHEAALAAHVPTIAVLGSGLDFDSIYPRQNVNLAKEILAAGGTLVSEHREKYDPRAYDFPLRNRIMIGLSHAVLVIEAAMKSGTLITARLALDYNRDVFTIPGSIFATHTEGPHMLLSNGAMLVTKSEDILRGLGLELTAELKLPAEMDWDALSKSNNFLDENHSQLEKSSKKHVGRTIENCSDIERKILRALAEPLSRSNLLQKIGGNVTDTTAALSLLEIKKFVVNSGGVLRRN